MIESMPTSLTFMQNPAQRSVGTLPHAGGSEVGTLLRQDGSYKMAQETEVAKIIVREAQIQTSCYFPLPIEQVFNYVTTSGNWPTWHPASQAVIGQTYCPMRLGEQVVERFRMMNYRGTIAWTVSECQAPYRWGIEGTMGNYVRGIITYTLSPEEKGTLFVRTFAYQLHKRWESVFDHLLGHRYLAAESSRALRRLQRVMLEIA